jgi:REP element-mobilizing transposase RayT
MEEGAPPSSKDAGDSPKGWHSRGYLPHFDAEYVVQAVTFRLGDSLPAEVVRSLQYRLYAWCVMPNHVHVVAAPAPGKSLGAIVRSWKVFTAKAVNRKLQRSGPLWHEDYFDRSIRNDEHFARVIAYVEHNPVKAGLAKNAEEWPWSSARRREMRV